MQLEINEMGMLDLWNGTSTLRGMRIPVVSGIREWGMIKKKAVGDKGRG